jgi:hypothetical protein
MKMGGRLLSLVAWMAFHVVIALPVAGAVKDPPIADTSAAKAALERKEMDRKRVADNQLELRRLRLEDSAGWDETKVLAKPKEDADLEQKERVQRKVSGLTGLCAEGRIARIAEVDSLKGMTAEEKAFCKARLNLINPLMP